MKKVQTKRIFITLIVGIVLVILFYFITSTITKYTGFSISDIPKESDFELCLKEQDITLYINTKDSAERLKKIELIDYLQYFKIINCYSDNRECVEKDVSFPVTWIINKNEIEKDISLYELSEFSGCKLS